jgi:transposase
MKYSIGIDWAAESHMICIREFDTRRIRVEFEIEHSASGLQQLEETLNALDTKPEYCAVAIETNQGILVNYLVGTGYVVHPIPPAAVKDYRGRRRRTGAKSDRDDAQILADILCLDLDFYPPIPAVSPLALEIKTLYRAHKQLVESRTRVISQLRQNLTVYYPVAVTLFARLDSPILRAFLATFPTQSVAQAASEQDLDTFFREHRYTRPDYIQAVINKLHQPAIPIPSWQASAGQMLTNALLDQLALLNEHIDQIDKSLASLLQEHPDGSIFLSLPRVGVILAAGLLGEIGDCRERFVDAGALQALAGTAPVTIQSGPSRLVRFRYACNKPLRHLLQHFARQSARADGSAWARGYLANQMERGHSASRAYRALANRWVCIIFRMWQDRTLYNENYHLQNIAQRGVNSPSLTYAQIA